MRLHANQNQFNENRIYFDQCDETLPGLGLNITHITMQHRNGFIFCRAVDGTRWLDMGGMGPYRASVGEEEQRFDGGEIHYAVII